MVNYMSAVPNRLLAPAIRIGLLIFLCVGLLASLPEEPARAQGETTSAIAGQVNDASGAPVPRASVTAVSYTHLLFTYPCPTTCSELLIP